MRVVELDGHEIVVCNWRGRYFAVQRRCGHRMRRSIWVRSTGSSLPAQCTVLNLTFTTGEALSGPVPADFGGESPPANLSGYLEHIGMQMKHVRTESISTYDTKVEAGWVHVAL